MQKLGLLVRLPNCSKNNSKIWGTVKCQVRYRSVRRQNNETLKIKIGSINRKAARNVLTKFMPRRSIWKGRFVDADAFLLK